MIDIKDIEKILEVVNKYDLAHFEFQQGNSKIIIDKQVPDTNKGANLGAKAVNQEEVLEISHKPQISLEQEKHYIKASFAGIFHMSKVSGGDPVVKINDEVGADTVVGLIEVMKLFNDVEAGIDGTIVDILVEEGDFVEFGQPLFEVKVK